MIDRALYAKLLPHPSPSRQRLSCGCRACRPGCGNGIGLHRNSTMNGRGAVGHDGIALRHFGPKNRGAETAPRPCENLGICSPVNAATLAAGATRALYWPIALPTAAALSPTESQETGTRVQPVTLKMPATLPSQLVDPAPPTVASSVQSEWFPKDVVC